MAAESYFHQKHDNRQRFGHRPDFLKVLRGKVEFVGAVRGRDDEIYLRLLDRYLRLDPKGKSRPILATERTHEHTLERAVWVLEHPDNEVQGTAFAVSGGFLITAEHVVQKPTAATQPGTGPQSYDAAVLARNPDYDVAKLRVNARLSLQLSLGSSAGLDRGHKVTLLGFPRYRPGDGVSVKRCTIVQKKMISKVLHYVIEPPIIVGNSGGPVLDAQNRVVGIAVKGQGEGGTFTSKDEVSCFVPIEALKSLENVAPDGDVSLGRK